MSAIERFNCISVPMHAYLFGDLFIENQGLEKPGRREETEKGCFSCVPHIILQYLKYKRNSDVYNARLRLGGY